jgi:hypothetical protein
MPRLLGTLLTATVLALSGCGDGGDEPAANAPGGDRVTTGAATPPPPATPAPAERGGGEPYPAAARQNFLRACQAQPGATRAACVCALDRIEAQYSYDEFRDIDRATARGERPPAAVGEIARRCGRETAGPDAS